jgi:acetoin utilization protein AcuB
MPMLAQKTKNIMTDNLVTTHFMESLASAYDRMKQNRIRHMPVLDDHGSVVGIISDRDFERASWPIQFTDGAKRLDQKVWNASAVVGNYMNGPVRAVSEDTEWLEVANIMINEKISSVLVMRDAELVGIVTHEDLLRVVTTWFIKPDSILQRTMSWAYNSPIGRLLTSLSDVGV